MTTREKFKRRVIELIHGVEYEEAIKKELVVGCKVEVSEEPDIGNGVFFIHQVTDDDEILNENEIKISKCGKDLFSVDKIIGLPITLARIMQALDSFNHLRIEKRRSINKTWLVINDDIWWKLTKDGKECDDSQQSDETIEALYKLIKKG